MAYIFWLTKKSDLHFELKPYKLLAAIDAGLINCSHIMINEPMHPQTSTKISNFIKDL